eukprot:856670-Prymnesium_polylepis.1
MSCWSCRAPTRRLQGSPCAAVGWSTAVGGACSSRAGGGESAGRLSWRPLKHDTGHRCLVRLERRSLYHTP